MKLNGLYNKIKTPAILGLALVSNVSLAADVEGADVYVNKIMVLMTLIVGVILFGLFLWGLITFSSVAPKIPELRENATDREAKAKIYLKLIGGVFAMAAPVIAVAVLISFFGEGLVQFYYASGAEDHADAMGVLNQLNGSTSTSTGN